MRLAGESTGMAGRIFDGPTAWNCLNGVINVYKPAGVKIDRVRSAILGNVCKDLNSLKVREPIQRVAIEPGGNQKYLIRKEQNLADHVLAVGPRYQLKDFKFNVAAGLGPHTSGVLVVGINNGTNTTMKIQSNRPLRAYHVTGRFGKATENFLGDSRVTLKAKFGHVRSERLGAMVASLQASNQRKMYEMCGVDLQSQAAYELASKGLFRPADNTLPVIFGMKLIHFQLPEFTLEVHAMNESEKYLAALINDIAIEQRSVAFCSGIRCIRHGHFSIEDSLLRRHWTLEGVLQNMSECRKIIKQHPQMLNRRDGSLTGD
ncbi:unnamed protein product [Hermetia illucens]|uniref:Pseudouridine synthase II N-terminal domain-containing protein n=1 Tax=Hermetia illucens TaxID=343691 RepID=A0A7R8Z1D8_HERIL|nr:mitochondrial mRNA pseudouridine synthase Trub2 [Hermetia illucens]CAD7093409.1 unnamed protein product [Hermetia illucens]